MCGTGFLSNDELVRGGDLAPGGTLRISGVLAALAVLDRLAGSSLLNIDSIFEEIDEL